MAQVTIGTPSYGSKKKNNWRIQDGTQVYRILPPLGSLASEGVWAVFASVHWGYRGSKFMVPFKCIQKKDFKTKMIKVQCPECDLIDQKKKVIEAHTTKLKAEGKTDDQIKETLKPLADWTFSHNLDKKWHVNAVKPDGSIGRLSMPHKMYAQLQLLIEKLVTNDGVDPIGAGDGAGVWFEFVRSGKGNQTTFSVTVVEQMEKVDGRSMKSNKPAPLTEDIISRLGSEAFDLSDAARVLNFEEISRLVDSNGDSEVVDAVFSSMDRTETSAADEAEEPDAGATASLPKQNALVTKSAPAPEVTASEEAAVAQLEAQLASLKARKSQPALAATAPAAPTMPANPSVLDDDNFIAQYGLGKK